MSVDRLVFCFPLCGRDVIVGSLRLHSVRTSGFGVAGGGFVTASDPSETVLA